MRLFAAVYPSGPALEDLARAVDGLAISRASEDGVNARVTDRALWHVTLAFIGEVPDDRCADASRALDRAAERVAATKPVLRVAGGGRFGRGRFTVLWAGLGGDAAGLGVIAAAVRHELRAGKLPFDRKHFNAHLTLARPGDRVPEETLRGDIAVLDRYRGPQWTCHEIALVASHLGPHPQHEIRHVAPIA